MSVTVIVRRPGEFTIAKKVCVPWFAGLKLKLNGSEDPFTVACAPGMVIVTVPV